MISSILYAVHDQILRMKNIEKKVFKCCVYLKRTKKQAKMFFIFLKLVFDIEFPLYVGTYLCT